MEPLKPVGKKIILVDDDTALLELYGKRFLEEGYDVTVADNGQTAWELIEKGFVPDVIFTGILMPRMTGFELIEKLQANEKLAKIPVAISSHRNRAEDRIKAKELNCDDFIAQGMISLAEVVRRVNLLVGIRKKFTIPISRGYGDAGALIRLLEVQQAISFSQEKKNFELEFEPKAEGGEFIVKLSPGSSEF